MEENSAPAMSHFEPLHDARGVSHAKGLAMSTDPSRRDSMPVQEPVGDWEGMSPGAQFDGQLIVACIILLTILLRTL